MTLYVLAGFLVVGLVCNWAVKPLASRWFMSDEEVAALQPVVPPHVHTQAEEKAEEKTTAAMVPIAWLAVGIPILWGVWVTLKSALVLFG